MKWNNKGYTLVEVMFVIMFITTITIIVAIGWVACHFLAKYW